MSHRNARRVVVVRPGSPSPAAEQHGITPVGAVTRGLIAGIIGTLAMDVWLYLQYRRGKGTQRFEDWEFSEGVTDWESAPAPAQVGRRAYEGLFQQKLPDDRARLVNNITHWGYGVSAAVVYGIVAGSLRRPRIGYGLLFGAAVWLSGYAVLPAMGLYKHLSEYDSATLAKDLTAHLVFGVTTSTAFAASLRPRAGRRR